MDIRDRLATLPAPPRSNAVHAIELLLSASPAYFDEGGRAGLAAWVEASLAWARERFGEANVVAAVLHRDEETPHLHVVAVPIVEKTLKGRHEPEERLCARDITGGRHRLSRLQDEYAAAVAHLGIERGVRGARIEYEHLHQRYAAMTGTPPAVGEVAKAIAVERPGRRVGDPAAYAAAQEARVRAGVLPRVEALAARCEELERSAEREGRRAAALQTELEAARAQAARAREVDLGRVVAVLGGVQARHDPHLWRVGGDTISVDHHRFKNLTQGREGVGAVEMLIQLTGCDYTRALTFLAQRGGAEVAAIAAAEYAARQAIQFAERARELPPERLTPVRAEERGR